jgi:hypothetical protein
MINDKPTSAVILTLIAGLLILIFGFITIAISPFLISYFKLVDLNALALYTLGSLGIICGIVDIIASFMMRNNDEKKVHLAGIIAFIFTLLSAFDGGGFIIGFILGIIGSSNGIIWKQEKPREDTLKL